MSFAQLFTSKLLERQLSLFKTPSNLPVLFYSTKQVTYKGETYPQMSLNMEVKPIIEQPPLDDLWTVVNNPNIQKAHEHSDGRIFAANIICNDVARRSRRAAGNILIVPNKTQKAWFDKRYTELKWHTRMTVVVDPSLEPNELRATYWKIMYKKECIGHYKGGWPKVITTDIPVAIDGGLQLSPEGFSCIQKEGDCWIDYHSYFARGFM